MFHQPVKYVFSILALVANAETQATIAANEPYINQRTPAAMGRLECQVRGRMLNLVLTYHWYDEIASGRKNIEYRAMSKKWMRDIWDKRGNVIANGVRFQRGYTQTSMICEIDDIDIGPCPYEGWDGEYIRIHLTSNARTKPRCAATMLNSKPKKPDGAASALSDKLGDA